MLNSTQEILNALREGKEDKVLTLLYKRARPKVRNYILRNNGTDQEANDIFQDALIIFYQQVKSGKYNPEYEIDGFIFTISRNLWINYAKRQQKNIKLDHTEAHTLTDSQNLLGELITREREEGIRQLFSALGERCKDLLLLVYFHKYSMKEVAEKMAFANENAAKTSNYKCKQKLIEKIKEAPDLKQLFKA